VYFRASGCRVPGTFSETARYASGDVICADGSGIVVVRKEFAADTCDYLSEQTERMANYVNSVKAGNFSNDWVDQQLAQDGCEFD